MSRLKVVMYDSTAYESTLVCADQSIYVRRQPNRQYLGEEFNEAVNQAYRPKICHQLSIRFLSKKI